jgi:hypothetical protein
LGATPLAPTPASKASKSSANTSACVLYTKTRVLFQNKVQPSAHSLRIAEKRTVQKLADTVLPMVP